MSQWSSSTYRRHDIQRKQGRQEEGGEKRLPEIESEACQEKGDSKGKWERSSTIPVQKKKHPPTTKRKTNIRHPWELLTSLPNALFTSVENSLTFLDGSQYIKIEREKQWKYQAYRRGRIREGECSHDDNVQRSIQQSGWVDGNTQTNEESEEGGGRGADGKRTKKEKVESTK